MKVAMVVAGNFNGRSWKGERRRSWRWRPAWWLLEEVKDGDGGLKKKKNRQKDGEKVVHQREFELGVCGWVSPGREFQRIRFRRWVIVASHFLILGFFLFKFFAFFGVLLCSTLAPSPNRKPSSCLVTVCST